MTIRSSKVGRVIPPTGRAASLYVRTDFRRGVWKAPAGMSVETQHDRGRQ
jgi:phage tail sheath protein FI